KADEMRKRGRNPAGRWYRLRIALPDIQPATGNKTRPPGGKLSLRATRERDNLVPMLSYFLLDVSYRGAASERHAPGRTPAGLQR
ncbi:MAG TPA: hypothetical protein V6D17_10475, partial [Candidatus Obscuribacterales bacterium]